MTFKGAADAQDDLACGQGCGKQLEALAISIEEGGVQCVSVEGHPTHSTLFQTCNSKPMSLTTALRTT